MTAQDQTTAAQAVLEADERRRAATVAGDVAALKELMSEGFTYVHSNGFREGRDGYTGRVESGLVEYIALERKDAEVRMFGDMAIVEGRASMTYRPRNQDKPLIMHTLYLAVWRNDRGRWRIEAYGSTLEPQ